MFSDESLPGRRAWARLVAARDGLYALRPRARRLRRRLRRPHQGPARARQIVEQGLKILENLDHRGAVGADKLMGDGAGILIQIRTSTTAPRWRSRASSCHRPANTASA